MVAFLLSIYVNDDGAKVVDVGERRPGDDEIIDRREKTIAVVVGEPSLGGNLALGGAPQGVGPENRAGVVFRAVNPIGIACDGANGGMSVQRHDQRQQKLGVATTAAFAAHGD